MLTNLDTHRDLPDFYIDRPSIYLECMAKQTWRADDRKRNYVSAEGSCDASAVECGAYRRGKRFET
jgi:hypothetical protein